MDINLLMYECAWLVGNTDVGYLFCFNIPEIFILLFSFDELQHFGFEV
jgi:hypothetical protein